MNADNRNEKGSPASQWRGRRIDRDDTPSFIRNVNQSMNAAGRGSDHAIPVLAMPASIRIWQKVRWPLLILVVLSLLVVVGVMTHQVLVSKSIERQIEEAGNQESAAQVLLLVNLNTRLKEMAADYPDRLNAQTAYAWNAILLAQIFGPRDTYLSEAKAALQAIDKDNSALGYAARIGKCAVNSQWKEGAALLEKAQPLFDGEPRLHLAKAWIRLGEDGPDAAIAELNAMRQKFGDYLPPLYTLISIGLQHRDMSLVAQGSTELLLHSSSNLYGSLTSILVRLPEWQNESLAPDEQRTFEDFGAGITEKIQGTPEQIQHLGIFVRSRIELLSGNHESAANGFQQILGNPSLNAHVWYGRAMYMLKGPKAALEAVANAEGDAADILGLRAQSYLDLHRIADAEAVFAQMERSETPPTSRLRWLMAVRKGDAAGAVQHMPSALTAEQIPALLEMHALLSQAGDADAIQHLAEQLQALSPDCAAAMIAFHRPVAKNAYDLVRLDDTCAAALGIRHMSNAFSPDMLARMGSLVASDWPTDPRIAVDRAMVLWKSINIDAALAMLNSIAVLQADAIPLRSAMASLYLRMGRYNDVLALIDAAAPPALLHHRIAALDAQKDLKARNDAIQQIANDETHRTHPATAYWLLQQKLDSGDYNAVLEQVEPLLADAGLWTVELADIKAKALNATGKRGDADRFLTATARRLIASSGLTASWEVQKHLIRLNLRRGGAFVFKAVAVTQDLYKMGVKDPELAYSYGIAFLRQGNEGGSLRFFREAIALDPTFVPPYEVLNNQGQLNETHLEALKKVRPDIEIVLPAGT